MMKAPKKPGVTRSAAERAAAELGVSLDGLTRQQVGAAFRRRIAATHPDAGGAALDAPECIRRAQEARKALCEWLDALPDDHCSTCRGSGYVRVLSFLQKPCPRCMP